MTVKFSPPIEQDPTIVNLLSNMPDTVKDSFSELQLSHLRNALGNQKWRHHSIDIRGTIPWFRQRFYYVIIAGKNQRQLSRHELMASALIKASFLALFITFSTLLGLLILYLIKSALGIDIFAGFSLGIWDWFKQMWGA